jgi:hypothetical protein
MGRRRRPRPWFDPEWWESLRERLRDGRRLMPGEMRALRRDTLDAGVPPRRRPMSAEGHGHGDQGGHHHDEHDHGDGHHNESENENGGGHGHNHNG